MGWKSILLRPFANRIAESIKQWSTVALVKQEHWRKSLVKSAEGTLFGQNHGFSSIQTYEDFKRQIPIVDYEDIKDFIDQVKSGKHDILWPGKPAYLAKTSGTTSGVKYIPLTKDSLPNHFGTAKNAIFNYAARSGNFDFFNGKIIFLSGSPALEDVNGIKVGRLSGIVNHQVPAWLRKNQVPSYKTNCLEDWEEKLEAIVLETVKEDMRLISGIPPWVQMYYERLIAKTGKETVLEIFPNYSVFGYGGVNFEPYRKSLESLVGAKIDSVETYPASE
ncbi:MAG: GH3 auxin-responsive promoter family protein [Saprospiraceae bacterium]